MSGRLTSHSRPSDLKDELGCTYLLYVYFISFYFEPKMEFKTKIGFKVSQDSLTGKILTFEDHIGLTMYESMGYF